jgi:hypothetical protein
MFRDRKKLQKMWVVIAVLMILGMLMFTLIPLIYSV